MKFGMVDYVRDSTPRDNIVGGSTTWVVWANMWLVTSPSLQPPTQLRAWSDNIVLQNFGMSGHMSTKLGGIIKGSTPKWHISSDWKLEVEFQYGGRLFSENVSTVVIR